MGSSYKGGTSYQHSFRENLPEVTADYPLNGNHFGTSHHGSTWTYEIEADNPSKAAKAFYDKIGLGGAFYKHGANGLEIVELSDGTRIVYRPITKSGSPAVEINIQKSDDNGGVKSHKIHFVKKKGK